MKDDGRKEVLGRKEDLSFYRGFLISYFLFVEEWVSFYYYYLLIYYSFILPPYRVK